MRPRPGAPPGLRAWRAQPSSGGLGQVRRAAFLPRRLSCPRGSVSLTGGPSTPGCWEGATLGSHSAPAHCSLTSGRKQTYVHTNRHTRMHTQTHAHRCTRRAHRGTCMHTHAQRGMCAIIDTHTCAHIHGCTNTHVCTATPMCMCAHRCTHMHAHAAEAGTEAENSGEKAQIPDGKGTRWPPTSELHSCSPRRPRRGLERFSRLWTHQTNQIQVPAPT